MSLPLSKFRPKVVAVVSLLKEALDKSEAASYIDYPSFTGYKIEERGDERIAVVFTGPDITEQFGLWFAAKDWVGHGSDKIVNKVQLSGLFPTEYGSNSTGRYHYDIKDSEEIGFAPSKDADKIVNDIVRRFWEKYVVRHKYACDKKAKEQFYAEKCLKVRQEIEAAFPGEFWPYNKDNRPDPLRPSSTSKGKFEDMYMSVSSDPEVPVAYEAKIRVTSLETLKKVHALLSPRY